MTEPIDISKTMSINLGKIVEQLPRQPNFVDGIRRAPARNFNLSAKDTELALKNALRYVPSKWHSTLAPEFLDELLTRGRIYGYRFRPEGRLRGKPIDEYRGQCRPGISSQLRDGCLRHVSMRICKSR